ncbi:MAG: ribonucleoside-diphosphate reductase subunit alpha [Candidatus Magasanikbacteria bacterium RIFCSPHIGHO2_02_FULL_47_14]|uniref:Ribonucleoside-diphosphate reductase n=1 Tax=Candidatus Magasanikbacteria bacterium RIFCSPHIGHO2_02_FULL_47_14 TaxID=1798680 RepID=A0A1F6MB23_9BACT|nr:MAG: ribonucleoside-diphosphate reductase subunit alpha [Candidatus Magasanikbacteria bacterium RIFCSPHIGHO2_02_FULL_47_14]
MKIETPLIIIKKRNGSLVPFEAGKIKIALEKAFVSTRGGFDEALSESLTREIVALAESQFADKNPGVEDIQNFVENVLMEAGYFDVAKHYIIYRYEHTKIREEKKQEVVKKIETGGLYVMKRSGTKELFSIEKLRRSIELYTKGYEEVINVDTILNQCRQEIYEDIDTREISRSIVMVLRSFIEHDPAYSYAASRAVLYPLYKDIIGSQNFDASRLHEQLKAAFPRMIQKAVGFGKLDPRVLTFDLEVLASTLDFSRDNLHPYLSTQTLVDRYFLQSPETEEVLETPQFFWMRVAMGLAVMEPKRMERAQEFYEVISTLRYVPSTPTLFHSATNHPQMSSCYLTTVDDSLDHIFKCVSDNAQLSKWSGGIGNDWTNLRGTGAFIKGTGVPSQGTIPFLKIASDTTAAINRSGRRRGATCAYLETWHWDIEDFLELRKNTGDERRRTHDMNTANWIPDLFFKRIREDGEWSLFSPDETSDLHHLYGAAFEKRYEEYERRGKRGEMKLYRVLKARDLWKKMITMLFETGHPWITFKDPSNLRSPQDHVGVVHSSNLCTEITLNTSFEETAVCNLGSVNLARHVTAGKLDETLLAHTVAVAMRMLDNVIDLNFYPTKEARTSNLKHRPVGLGIMGLHDALYQLHINFDSDAAVDFSDTSMELLAYYAVKTSSDLARERGAYESYRGSKWDRGIFPIDTLDLLEKERGIKIDVPRTAKKDWTSVREAVKQYGMRNSNCMAIAPTATISNIAGCIPTIEPIYKNIYVKANQAGDFTIVNPYLVAELKKRNLWDAEMLGKLKYQDGSIANIPEVPQDLKDRFKEVFEIDGRWLIKGAAYRGKWIDQSQSLNIFYSGHSGKELSDIYMYAWEMGLKTTYYLRSMGASQVEKSTVNASVYGDTHKRSNFSTARVESGVVPQEVPTAMPSANAEPVMATSVAEPKMCKINDPDCEACQ